jgi:hypothetical protein
LTCDEACGPHALMMAVRKHQNIVQRSYRRVPLNVVPRIPLLGYLDINQGHICQMKGRAYPTDPDVSLGKRGITQRQKRAHQRTGVRPSMVTAKPILALVSYRERSAFRRQFDSADVSADEGAF